MLVKPTSVPVHMSRRPLAALADAYSELGSRIQIQSLESPATSH